MSRRLKRPTFAQFNAVSVTRLVKRLVENPFGALFIAAGAVLLSYSLLQLWRAFRSLKWPITEAEIVHNSIEEPGGRRRGFEPVVRYRYVCEGRTYDAGRLVFSSVSVTGSRDDAEQLLKLLPVGARIPIRVCPAKPQLSVIKSGCEPAWWLPLAMSLVLIVLGLSL